MRPKQMLSLLVVLLTPNLAAGEELTLARVGDDTIDARELKDEFVRRHGGHAVFLGGESEIRAFLEQVIDRRLLLQEAYRLGLDEFPEIRTAAADFAERKATERLVFEETEAKARPTEAEIEEAWRTRTTTLYRVGQIVVPDREAAEEVARELSTGADFEALARTRSTARSRLMGGTIPSIGWGATSPEWEGVVFALAPGETTPPFRSSDGWEIVRMIEKRTVDPPEFDQARLKIEGILSQRKLAARQAEFSRELWEKYEARLAEGIVLEPRHLANLLESSPQTPLVTWNGGELPLETFASDLDLGALATGEPDRAGEELERLVRLTVNDQLARLEAEERRVVEQPELAREVRNAREGLMEGALYADYLLRGVELREEEVQAWYDEHRAELAAPERRRVAHLVVATRAEAEALRERIGHGEDFATLVKAHSTDVQTRSTGGDLGWVTARDTPPGFEPVLSLAIGEVSAPIESKFGWHLIRVETIEPARERPFDEVSDELRSQLLERRKTERRREWIAQLREATQIEVDAEAIAALAAESAAATGEPPARPH